MKKIRCVAYILLQCTWGLLQTLAGAVVFLVHVRDRHSFYHGAVVTEWSNRSSVSLGEFVFVAKDPYLREDEPYTREEKCRRLLVHEYGHTIQSLILGPLYLFVVGIPSCSWANLPPCVRRRRQRQISYYSFYTERWANALGKKVTGSDPVGEPVKDRPLEKR